MFNDYFRITNNFFLSFEIQILYDLLHLLYLLHFNICYIVTFVTFSHSMASNW